LAACGAGNGGVPSPSSTLLTFALPSGTNGPNALAQDFRGNVWFVTSASATRPSAVGAIGTAGATTIYYGGEHQALHDDAIGFFGIAAGPDGNMWFSEPLNGKVVRVTPSGSVTEIAARGALPFKVTPGPGPAMWYTLNGSSAIGRVAIGSAPTATAYPIPSPRPQATANVQAIVAGTDGNLYFTDCGASGGGLDGIGQVTLSPSVRVQPEIAVPTQRSCPQGIVAGRDASVWFLESNPAIGVYNVARLSPRTPFARSTIVEYPMPVAPGKLAFLTASPDGTLWTANGGATPGSITHITRLPPAGSQVAPQFATLDVPLAPIPIADGPQGGIWFGTPSVSALFAYR